MLANTLAQDGVPWSMMKKHATCEDPHRPSSMVDDSGVADRGSIIFLSRRRQDGICWTRHGDITSGANLFLNVKNVGGAARRHTRRSVSGVPRTQHPAPASIFTRDDDCPPLLDVPCVVVVVQQVLVC